MPEGPEIRRAADRIAGAIANKPLQEVWFAFPHLKKYETQLGASQIQQVETRGKGLLMHFDCGLSIYSHNQLYGKWMIRKAYNYPQTKRQLRLALHCDRKSALLYSASDIDVLDGAGIQAHPFLSRIGPDVLSSSTTVEQVQERLSCDRFRRRRLTTLFLDQHFLAGLGNYLRSEILFVARVHPSLRPADCTDEQIEKLAEAALALPRQSYETGGITNDIAWAAKLKSQGFARRVYRHWVFARAGQLCWVCATPIVKDSQGGRRYYYCPQCQEE